MVLKILVFFPIHLQRHLLAYLTVFHLTPKHSRVRAVSLRPVLGSLCNRPEAGLAAPFSVAAFWYARCVPTFSVAAGVQPESCRAGPPGTASAPPFRLASPRLARTWPFPWGFAFLATVMVQGCPFPAARVPQTQRWGFLQIII